MIGFGPGPLFLLLAVGLIIFFGTWGLERLHDLDAQPSSRTGGSLDRRDGWSIFDSHVRNLDRLDVANVDPRDLDTPQISYTNTDQKILRDSSSTIQPRDLDEAILRKKIVLSRWQEMLHAFSDANDHTFVRDDAAEHFANTVHEFGYRLDNFIADTRSDHPGMSDKVAAEYLEDLSTFNTKLDDFKEKADEFADRLFFGRYGKMPNPNEELPYFPTLVDMWSPFALVDNYPEEIAQPSNNGSNGSIPNLPRNAELPRSLVQSSATPGSPSDFHLEERRIQDALRKMDHVMCRNMILASPNNTAPENCRAGEDYTSFGQFRDRHGLPNDYVYSFMRPKMSEENAKIMQQIVDESDKQANLTNTETTPIQLLVQEGEKFLRDPNCQGMKDGSAAQAVLARLQARFQVTRPTNTSTPTMSTSTVTVLESSATPNATTVHTVGRKFSKSSSSISTSTITSTVFVDPETTEVQPSTSTKTITAEVKAFKANRSTTTMTVTAGTSSDTSSATITAQPTRTAPKTNVDLAASNLKLCDARGLCCDLQNTDCLATLVHYDALMQYDALATSSSNSTTNTTSSSDVTSSSNEDQKVIVNDEAFESYSDIDASDRICDKLGRCCPLGDRTCIYKLFRSFIVRDEDMATSAQTSDSTAEHATNVVKRRQITGVTDQRFDVKGSVCMANGSCCDLHDAACLDKLVATASPLPIVPSTAA
ncbi:MAG: hypothetical protein M1828_005209 [Chrysothrix sp. TS-e1954]|nr:MAG: hypothetical protein M1828_005209 [Chrysothrix sp. TS-e1954]